MSPFITFKDQNKAGDMTYYILQREWPHYVGYIAYSPIPDPICQIPVTGHNLWLTFAGTLRGAYIPIEPNVQNEILSVFHNMERWFYANRIQAEPKRYKKWAI